MAAFGKCLLQLALLLSLIRSLFQRAVTHYVHNLYLGEQICLASAPQSSRQELISGA